MQAGPFYRSIKLRHLGISYFSYGKPSKGVTPGKPQFGVQSQAIYAVFSRGEITFD